MTTQLSSLRSKLTLHAVARTIVDQVIADTNPVFRHKVLNERGEGVVFITNTRAVGIKASWQISRITDGRISESAGDYFTAEDALSALQNEIDNAA
jgi:hypothetical protein